MPNLNDYELDLADLQDDPKSAIRKLLAIYQGKAKSYRESGEKATTGIKKVSEAIKTNDETTVNLTDSLIEQIRETIYETLVIDPKVSVLLFERLQDVKDGIGSFRQEALRGFDLPEDDDDDTEVVDVAAMFEEVEFLHKALSNFVNFAQMAGLSIHDLPGDLITTGKKSGKKEVSLPRKPNNPETKESDSAKGRHAAVYQMRYSVNGESVPSGTSLNRLALFYCSTPTEWINGSELMDSVEKQTGDSWGKGDWEITVPVGTLTAKKEVKP